jgi:DNA-binding MarR family transcriptional regulator
MSVTIFHASPSRPYAAETQRKPSDPEPHPAAPPEPGAPLCSRQPLHATMTEVTPGARALQVLTVLRQLQHALDLHSRFLIQHHGLTGPQAMTLHELSRRGDAITAGAVARAVSLSQATLTGIAERLEKRGLVVRRRSDHDRRQVLLRITPAGEALVREAPLLQPAFLRAFESLPERRQETLLAALRELAALMAGPEPGAVSAQEPDLPRLRGRREA